MLKLPMVTSVRSANRSYELCSSLVYNTNNCESKKSYLAITRASEKDTKFSS